MCDLKDNKWVESHFGESCTLQEPIRQSSSVDGKIKWDRKWGMDLTVIINTLHALLFKIAIDIPRHVN